MVIYYIFGFTQNGFVYWTFATFGSNWIIGYGLVYLD